MRLRDPLRWTDVAKKAAAKPAATKQPATKKVAAKASPAKKAVPVKTPAPAKKAMVNVPVPAAKAAVAAPPAVVSAAAAKVAVLVPDSAASLKKLTESLRKMGDKRPTKLASLWRSPKSFLGAGATEESVVIALARLIEEGVVKVDSVKGASYPRFDAATGSTAAGV